ncbi:Aldehyde/histidinol dehydrogenase [Mariannaea sp. PMI_226]|nr:Aldehyde/histidinol dehydrogenase [Mariannaea sp. PMI_226]
MSSTFSQVRGSAIDGRARNPFFQKEQLKKLHLVLSANATKIRDSIVQDHARTEADVKAELWLAVRCVADAYTSVDPKKELQLEHAISEAKDAPDAKEPIGVIVIEPAKHTFLYSLISGLATAIANGNCVVVQAERTLLQSPQLILSLMQQALDKDIFTVTYEPVTDEALRCRSARLVQESPERRRVIATVERDANVQEAAKALVAARFCLCGKSQYAPDLVLVNEWIKKDFLKAVIQEFTLLSPAVGGVGQNRNASRSATLDILTKNGHVDVISCSGNMAIVDINDRQSSMLRQRPMEIFLAIHSITSMDDAITLINSFGRIGAHYVFTARPTAKYIAQFVDAQMTFVDHIPVTLIYSPLIPNDMVFSPSSSSPYNKSYFTLPSPRFTNSTAHSLQLSDLDAQVSLRKVDLLLADAMASLPDMKRRNTLVSRGFFEQGILTGAIMVFGGAAFGLSTFAYYTLRFIRSG